MIIAYIFDKNSASRENFKLFFSYLDSAVFLGKLDLKYGKFEDFDSAIDWIKTI